MVKKGCWLPVGKNTQNAAAGEVLALVNTDSYHSNIGFHQANFEDINSRFFCHLSDTSGFNKFRIG